MTSRTVLTPKQALAVLRARIERSGSAKAFAEEIGTTAAYVSTVLHGQRPPSDTILKELGLTRATVYLRNNDGPVDVK